MKNKNAIILILLFMVYGLIFYLYKGFDLSVYSVDFCALAIIKSSFPFGVIKNSVVFAQNSPIYYLLLVPFKFFNSILAFRIVNFLISFCSLIAIYKIGKLIKSYFLGAFVAFFLALNHFYIFYSSKLTLFVLSVFCFLCLILNLIKFFKKPTRYNLKYLIFFNCLYLFVDINSIFFITIELCYIYLIYSKKEKYFSYVKLLIKRILNVFVIILPIIIFKIYYVFSSLIPYQTNSIKLNFSSLYLLINEYISPFLSFEINPVFNFSNLGMMFSYFLNPSFNNLNSLKLFITLFYSSFLPIALFIFLIFKALNKKLFLKRIFVIATFYFIFYLGLFYFKFFELSPIYTYQFFLISLLLFSFGFINLKDKLAKTLIIICFVLIQFVKPDINSYNISINKNYPTINVFEKFAKEQDLKTSDLVIAPYLNRFYKTTYKNYNFFDFDYDLLRYNKKNSIVNDLIQQKFHKKLDKKNIYFLSKNYLNYPNDEYFANLFLNKCIKEDNLNDRIILFVDKLNSKPISPYNISKFTSKTEYDLSLREIDFKNIKLNSTSSKILYDSMKSKTLFNLINVLNSNFYLDEVVQYKKYNDNYYRIFNNTKDVDFALFSAQSQYVFLIYKKRVM